MVTRMPKLSENSLANNRTARAFLLLVLLLSLPLTANAQNRWQRHRQRVDSVLHVRKKRVKARVDSVYRAHSESINRVDSALAAKYGTINYDPRYIARPAKRLTLKVRANVSGTHFRATGTSNGLPAEMNLSTANRGTLSLGMNYLGLSAGLAINPAALAGRNKDNEFRLSIYNNRYTFDASFQMTKTMSGHVDHEGNHIEVESGMVRMNMLNVTGYYIFNHNRYSMPAAMTQSYIQRRSAGSWMAGFAFQGGDLKTTDQKRPDMLDTTLGASYLGIGGGYGYNLVWRDKWLFHLSALPTIIVLNLNNFEIGGIKRDMHTRFPDLIFNESLAVIRTLNQRHFVGATFNITHSLLGDAHLEVTHRKWQARLVWGIRL